MDESILMTEESEHETMFNQMQYHKIFEELSQVRSDLRAMKQENQWLKNAKQGLQEEAMTLRDILRQKKTMITSLTEQLSQKSFQLQEIERELSEELAKEQNLIDTLKQYEQRIEELTEQGNRPAKQERQDVQKQDVRKCNHDMLMSLTEQRLILHIDKSLQEMQHIFQKYGVSAESAQQSTISNKIQRLISINNQLVQSTEKVNRELQTATQSINQKNIKINELQFMILQTEERHKIQMEKQDVEFKKQLNSVGQIHQETKKTIYVYEQRMEEVIRELEDCRSKMEKYRQERDSWKRQAFQHYIPYLKPYIPEELPGLLQDLQNLTHGDQSKKIIQKEVNRLENLYACQKKRTEKIETNQNSMKNQIVQLTGENQILRLKVANLERAYENAIDDYRRSIRFTTVTKKHTRGFTSTTDKENQAGTGRNFN